MMDKKNVIQKRTIEDEIFYGFITCGENKIYVPDRDTISKIAFSAVKAIYANIAKDCTIYHDAATECISPN